MSTRRGVGLGCAISVLVVIGLVIWAAYSFLHAPRQAWCVAWSGDGKMLAAGFGWYRSDILPQDPDQTVRIWYTDHLDQKPVVLKGYGSPVDAVAFSPDGHYLASGEEFGTEVLLWDTHNLSAPTAKLGLVGNYALAFSPNGRWLAGVGGFWDLQTLSAPPITLSGGNQLVNPASARVTNIAWLPDNQTLIVGASDGRVRIWNTSHPELPPTILKDNNKPVFVIAVSKDGTRLAGMGQQAGDLRLWDLRHLDQAPSMLKGLQGVVTTMDFSPDGNLLAASTAANSAQHNDVLLWDLPQPQTAPLQLHGHSEAVEDLAFSPDGKWLASASYDTTVRIWSMQQPQSAPRVLPH